MMFHTNKCRLLQVSDFKVDSSKSIRFNPLIPCYLFDGGFTYGYFPKHIMATNLCYTLAIVFVTFMMTPQKTKKYDCDYICNLFCKWTK